MFEFFEEIAQKSGLPLSVFNDGFKVINFSNKLIFVEHFKSIINFTTEEISIKLSRGAVKISGIDLKIKHMNLDTLIIVGNISTLEIT